MSAAVDAARPLAVRLGFRHVSIAENENGWLAVCWSPATGPMPFASRLTLPDAIDEARAYAAVASQAVLDLHHVEDPGSQGGWVHVDMREDGHLEITHEGRSGQNFATVAHFDAADRKRAVLFALGARARFNARLGRLALWQS